MTPWHPRSCGTTSSTGGSRRTCRAAGGTLCRCWAIDRREWRNLVAIFLGWGERWGESDNRVGSCFFFLDVMEKWPDELLKTELQYINPIQLYWPYRLMWCNLSWISVHYTIPTQQNRFIPYTLPPTYGSLSISPTYAATLVSSHSLKLTYPLKISDRPPKNTTKCIQAPFCKIGGCLVSI